MVVYASSHVVLDLNAPPSFSVKSVACKQPCTASFNLLLFPSIHPSLSSFQPYFIAYSSTRQEDINTMFSRLTKPASSKDNTQHPPPTTPKSKTTSTHGHSKSQSSQHAISSPSKIPVASNPSRSALNPDSERSNYLSFLFSQSQQGQATTPVKVNPKVQQSAVPQVYGHHDRYHNPYESEGRYNPAQPQAQAQQSDDVHMQTMKNTVNPAMLKQLANIPPAPPRKEREEPIRPGRMAPVAEDVHMRTVKHEPVMEKPKGLEEWEKRLVESADSKRKATVAQLCEYFLVYATIRLTV